ncbi:ATP synthase F1 subunit delta [Candidatus Riflebacteria bacterium]
MKKTSIIAKRYALGLFSAIQSNPSYENNLLEHLEGVQHDLNLVLASLGKEKSSINFFVHPLVTLNEKVELLEKAFKANVRGEVFAILKLLVRKHRFYLIRSFIREYERILQKFEGFLEVTVRSKSSLKPEQKKKLKDQVKKLTAVQNVRIVEMVNNNILGGISLQIGDRLYDATLENQLVKFEQALKIKQPELI